MRILLITNMFPRPTAPSAGIFMLHSARHLRLLGHTLHVIHPLPRPPFPFNIITPWKRHFDDSPRRADMDGFEVDFPCYWSSYKLIPTRWSGEWLHLIQGGFLWKTARRFRPDLIWALPALPEGWAAMKLAHRLDLPYVVTILGADINETIHLPGARAKVSEVYNHTAGVTANSSRLINAAREVSPTARLRLIYLGFDPEASEEGYQRRQESRRRGDRQSAFRVVSVSNLIPTKGLHYNLQALSSLKHQYPNLCYDIAGDGPERPRLEQLSREYQLSDRVRFHGALPYAEVLRLMAEADFLSLPSYREGFGMVYLEAMALGVPVIGVEGQGVIDIVRDGENGLLVKPEDAESLTAAWEALLSDDAVRSRLGEAGRRSVVDKLSWTATGENYQQFFQEVVADWAHKKGEY